MGTRSNGAAATTAPAVANGVFVDGGGADHREPDRCCITGNPHRRNRLNARFAMNPPAHGTGGKPCGREEQPQFISIC